MNSGVIERVLPKSSVKDRHLELRRSIILPLLHYIVENSEVNISPTTKSKLSLLCGDLYELNDATLRLGYITSDDIVELCNISTSLLASSCESKDDAYLVYKHLHKLLRVVSLSYGRGYEIAHLPVVCKGWIASNRYVSSRIEREELRCDASKLVYKSVEDKVYFVFEYNIMSFLRTLSQISSTCDETILNCGRLTGERYYSTIISGCHSPALDCVRGGNDDSSCVPCTMECGLMFETRRSEDPSGSRNICTLYCQPHAAKVQTSSSEAAAVSDKPFGDFFGFYIVNARDRNGTWTTILGPPLGMEIWHSIHRSHFATLIEGTT